MYHFWLQPWPCKCIQWSDEVVLSRLMGSRAMLTLPDLTAFFAYTSHLDIMDLGYVEPSKRVSSKSKVELIWLALDAKLSKHIDIWLCVELSIHCSSWTKSTLIAYRRHCQWSSPDVGSGCQIKLSIRIGFRGHFKLSRHISCSAQLVSSLHQLR